jgi:DNA polymerase I-like protein with 3'-5' exonuclease and polymerase domains
VLDTAEEHYVDATCDDIRGLFDRRPPALGVDTEGWAHKPWSIQLSDAPGVGLVARSKEAIAEFARLYNAADPKPLLIFHPALHELPMLAVMGIDVPDDGFTDTSLKAHLLGIVMADAKSLFMDLAGMDQDSYMEITGEASERMARDFLYAMVSTWPRYSEPAKVKGGPRRKKGEPKPPKPGPLHPLESALRLVERMLCVEDAKSTLRQRWAASTARERLQDELEIVSDMPEPTLDDVPLSRAIRYAGRDADGTLRIDGPLDARIDRMGLRGALNADIEAVPMLNRMQVVGMGVDVAFFHAYSAELGVELVIEQGKLDTLVGAPLNVNSTVAVPHYLFDTLNLPIRKRTDSGAGSTNDKILEAMRLDPRIPEHARNAIGQIQTVREIRKIKSSFADAIPQFVRSGRVHPRFRIVSTGRLAASDPNLLAFPKHSDRGLRIREGFVAAEGHLLGSCDLSQVEMRFFAIDCGDENMMAQFRLGHDFHLMGAAEKLGRNPEEMVAKYKAKDPQTMAERFQQKAINFGILMGITEYGLLDQFQKAGLSDYTLDDMRRFLAEWFRQYPAAGPYIEGKHCETRRNGFVRDMWGRLRYLPDIYSTNKYTCRAAERQAQATPTQSAAAGFMRRWMKKVWDRQRWVREHEGWYWEPLLQVHDDLITEFDSDRQMAVEKQMADALSDLQWFDIPITTGEPTAGLRWSDI